MNAPNAQKRIDLRGLTEASRMDKRSHAPNPISTMVLKKKPLPVMNGKNKSLATRNGIIKTAKIHETTAHLRIWFNVI
jgi:hypothetical protein